MYLIKEKTYSLVKTNKNNEGSGTYTKKSLHTPPKSITPSSNSSSNSSSKELLPNHPKKQNNYKKAGKWTIKENKQIV